MRSISHDSKCLVLSLHKKKTFFAQAETTEQYLWFRICSAHKKEEKTARNEWKIRGMNNIKILCNSISKNIEKFKRC